MFGNMKALMEMKNQADKMKKELDVSLVTLEEVRGIKLTVNGSQQFKSVEIDEAMLMAGNKKRFEADLLRSLNAAMNKSQQLAAEKMKALMPGFPGLS